MPAAASALTHGRWSRLAVLRPRLRRAARLFAAAFVLANFLAQELFVLTALPLVDAWQALQAAGRLGQPVLHFRSLTDPFFTYLGQSMWAALVVTLPYLAYHVWAAVLPAGRRPLWPVTVASALSFAAGVAFCHVLVMPVAFEFLLGYTTTTASGVAIEPRLNIAEYADLARRLMLGFGLVFELPVIIYILARLRLVTHRGLWRFNRHAIVLSFIVAAFLTPGPDIVSQLLMAAPLIVLYNLSILVALLTRRAENDAATR